MISTQETFPTFLQINLCCYFQVTAVNPQVAELAKAMILKWSDVMSLTWAPPGTIPSPVIEITDDVATIPPPYL